MIGVALKGLLGRKLRATLTAFAIVLGVAMISGAFVLTDTLGKSFDGIYDESYKATDAVISSKVAIKTTDGETEAPAFSGRRARRGGGPARRARRAGLDRGRGEARRQERQGDRTAPARASRSASTPTERPEPQPAPARRRASGRSGDGQIAIDDATAERAALRGRPDRRRVRRRPARRGTRSAASSASAPADSLGGSTICRLRPRRPRSGCSTSRASST